MSRNLFCFCSKFSRKFFKWDVFQKLSPWHDKSGHEYREYYPKNVDDVHLQQVKLMTTENKMENYYYFQDFKTIYKKFNNLKEVISLINNSYKYDNAFVDKMILFINKLEEIKNDNFKDIIILVNDIILEKK